MLNVFKVLFVLCNKVLHLTDGYIHYCAHALVHCVKEVFTTFIHDNIKITWVFFLFRRNRSLFIALIIISNWSFFTFFLFIVACTRCVDDLKLFHIQQSNSRLNIFVDVLIFLLTHFFPSASDLTLLIRSGTCFLLLIIL